MDLIAGVHVMPFIITNAVDCSVDLGTYNSSYKKDDLVHLACESQHYFQKLNEEFGTQSRNYGYLFQYSAPKSFARCITGTGQHPISSHVMPYLIDARRQFTSSGATIGGMFIMRQDLHAIKAYLEQAFPEEDIIDESLRTQYQP
jgi:hypothetical protein